MHPLRAFTALPALRSVLILQCSVRSYYNSYLIFYFEISNQHVQVNCDKSLKQSLSASFYLKKTGAWCGASAVSGCCGVAWCGVVWSGVEWCVGGCDAFPSPPCLERVCLLPWVGTALSLSLFEVWYFAPSTLWRGGAFSPPLFFWMVLFSFEWWVLFLFLYNG